MSSTPRPSPVLGEPLAKRHRTEIEDDQHTPSNPLSKTQGDFDLLILPDDHDEEKNPTIRYQKRFMVVRIHELKRTISSLEDKLRSLSASERHTQSLFLVIDQHWKILERNVVTFLERLGVPVPPSPSSSTSPDRQTAMDVDGEEEGNGKRTEKDRTKTKGEGEVKVSGGLAESVARGIDMARRMPLVVPPKTKKTSSSSSSSSSAAPSLPAPSFSEAFLAQHLPLLFPDPSPSPSSLSATLSARSSFVLELLSLLASRFEAVGQGQDSNSNSDSERDREERERARKAGERLQAMLTEMEVANQRRHSALLEALSHLHYLSLERDSLSLSLAQTLRSFDLLRHDLSLSSSLPSAPPLSSLGSSSGSAPSSLSLSASGSGPSTSTSGSTSTSTQTHSTSTPSSMSSGPSTVSGSGVLAGSVEAEETARGLREQLEEMGRVAARRKEEVERAMGESERLKEEVRRLKEQMAHPSKETVKASRPYQKLLLRLSSLQAQSLASSSASASDRDRLERNIAALSRQIDDADEAKRSIHDLFLSKIKDLDLQLRLLLHHQPPPSSTPSSSSSSSSTTSLSVWETQQQDLQRLRAENTAHLLELARLRASLDDSSSSTTSSGGEDVKELQRTNRALQAEVEAIAQVLSDLEQENSSLKDSLRIKEECNQKLSAHSAISRQQDSATRDKLALLEDNLRLLSPQLQRKDDLLQVLNDQLLLLRSQLTREQEMRVQKEQEAETQRGQMEQSVKKCAALKELNDQLQKKMESHAQLLHGKSGELEQTLFKLREAQDENERLKARIGSAALNSSTSSLRSSSSNMLEEQLQLYKSKVMCPICKDNHKDTVITKCYHVICQTCINENLRVRNRKCPVCSRPFAESDVHTIF